MTMTWAVATDFSSWLADSAPIDSWPCSIDQAEGSSPSCHLNGLAKAVDVGVVDVADAADVVWDQTRRLASVVL